MLIAEKSLRVVMSVLTTPQLNQTSCVKTLLSQEQEDAFEDTIEPKYTHFNQPSPGDDIDMLCSRIVYIKE